MTTNNEGHTNYWKNWKRQKFLFLYPLSFMTLNWVEKHMAEINYLISTDHDVLYVQNHKEKTSDTKIVFVGLKCMTNRKEVHQRRRCCGAISLTFEEAFYLGVEWTFSWNWVNSFSLHTSVMKHGLHKAGGVGSRKRYLKKKRIKIQCYPVSDLSTKIYSLAACLCQNTEEKQRDSYPKWWLARWLYHRTEVHYCLYSFQDIASIAFSTGTLERKRKLWDRLGWINCEEGTSDRKNSGNCWLPEWAENRCAISINRRIEVSPSFRETGFLFADLVEVNVFAENLLCHCGIRKGIQTLERYRVTSQKIYWIAANKVHGLGYITFVLYCCKESPHWQRNGWGDTNSNSSWVVPIAP